MKNARIGLLVLSVFAFQNMDAKSDKDKQKQKQAQAQKAAAAKKSAARKAPAVKKSNVVLEQDSHTVEVDERPIRANERVAPSVETNVSENPETGLVTEVKTTVTPVPEENKVVTTTETWTWTDIAKTAGKVALGAAVVGGAGYLAYQNHEGFRNGVDSSASYVGDATNTMSKSMGQRFGDFKQSAAEGIVNAQERFNNWRSGTTATATSDVNQLLAQDSEQVVNAAQIIGQASSNEQDAQMADKVATEIQNAIDNGKKPTLSDEESNWFMDKVVEYKNELAVGAGTGLVAAAAYKFPAIKQSINRLNPGYAAGEGVTAGLAKFSGSAESAAVRSVGGFTPQSSNVMRPATVNPGLSETQSAIRAENAARSVDGFTPQSGNVMRPPTVNPGMKKLSETEANITIANIRDSIDQKIQAQNRTQQARAGAQAEIDAQYKLHQQYRNRATADLNKQQAADQLANQAAMAQQVGLTAANLGIAGGVAAGANALANADMSAPSMNLDYAAEYN